MYTNTAMRSVEVKSPLETCSRIFSYGFFSGHTFGLTLYVKCFECPVGFFDDVPSLHMGCGNLRRD